MIDQACGDMESLIKYVDDNMSEMKDRVMFVRGLGCLLWDLGSSGREPSCFDIWSFRTSCFGFSVSDQGGACAVGLDWKDFISTVAKKLPMPVRFSSEPRHLVSRCFLNL